MTTMRRLGLAVLVPLLGACGDADATPDSSQLQAMIDSMLPAVERVSGMQATGPVRGERRDREELRRYVEERLAEELPAEELEKVGALYTELGLLPDTLDLRALLLDLFTEQVVGYYDPPTKTLYLIEGISAEAAEPVLAHELVHALQDQHVDLDSLIDPELGNDRSSAAQAAVEGHATLVMFALLLEQRTGGAQDITQLPDIGAQLRPAFAGQNSQFPVLAGAPRIIQETLVFPYVGGADFVQAVWRAHGGEARPPFRSILPGSTEQVLHPREAFVDSADAPTAVELAAPAGDWRLVYEDVLGELELCILLRDHLGTGAERTARGWDGDMTRLLESGLGERAVVQATVWDDAASADAFADAYRRILDMRPARHGTVQRVEVDGRPVVLVVDASTGVPRAMLPAPSVAALSETPRAAAHAARRGLR